jgi:uncharacterized protein YgiM (DUF1202 family)
MTKGNFSKIIQLLVIGGFLLGASTVFSAVAYVSSVKAKLYSEAKASSTKIANLHRGQRLTVLKKKGSWLNVQFGSKKGWIKKMFTRKNKPGKKFSILGSASANARIHARKRASTSVTAASARGLDDDSTVVSMGRARELDNTGKKFDPRVLEQIENVFVAEETLLKFLEEGGIK